MNGKKHAARTDMPNKQFYITKLLYGRQYTVLMELVYIIIIQENSIDIDDYK